VLSFEVHRLVIDQLQDAIYCGDTEHLDWMLRCARSTPLSLIIESPIDLDQLGLIYSRNCCVDALVLELGLFTQLRPMYDGIKNFNFTSLSKLGLYAEFCDPEDLLMVLDLALKSTQERIQLILNIRKAIPLLFHHQLMQRVDRLWIKAGQ
jgi:hypothetical protein